MQDKRLMGILLILMALAGCAQVVSGDTQDIMVQTVPKSGAHCVAQNARGTSALLATPELVTLLRSSSTLTITCRTDDGWSGSTSFESHISPIAYAEAVTLVAPAVDVETGAAYDYPANVVVALQAPPAGTVRQRQMSFGAEGGDGIPPPPDMSDADRARMRDDNVATRFQALRLLLDEGLITTEEYNTRRGANLGALLRYSRVPGARDLDRSAPPPRTLVARLKYLAAAYVEHSITASEQAAERAAILEGLLPARPVKRADPPPPIRDQMHLAAELGRIERLLLANVITEKEATAEKAKVTQLLEAAIAADDAAARAAAGMTMTLAPPSSGIGVALSIHSSESQARRIWAGLQKVYPDDLGGLTLQMKTLPRPHRPSHYQIIAGPLSDQTAAVALCKTLRRRGVACAPAKFGE